MSIEDINYVLLTKPAIDLSSFLPSRFQDFAHVLSPKEAKSYLCISLTTTTFSYKKEKFLSFILLYTMSSDRLKALQECLNNNF